jgi:hypothetical protein
MSRLHRIERGEATALLALGGDFRWRASTKFGHTVDAPCRFEDRREDFWLHRLLMAHGVGAYVLEPTGIGHVRQGGGDFGAVGSSRDQAAIVARATMGSSPSVIMVSWVM